MKNNEILASLSGYSVNIPKKENQPAPTSISIELQIFNTNESGARSHISFSEANKILKHINEALLKDPKMFNEL